MAARVVEPPDFDCIVVGAGLAGVVAAVRLRQSGRTVCVLSDGPGATALSSGALGPDARLAADDLRWLVAVLPDALVVRADGALQRLATAAGRIVEVLAAPPGSLDLAAPARSRVGLVGADVSGMPDLVGLARLLHDAANGRTEFLPLPVPAAVHDDVALYNPGALAGRLASDAELVRELVAGTERAVREAGVEAVLLPPYVPLSAVEAVRTATKLPTGRIAGTYGTGPCGGQLQAALQRALGTSGAEVRSGRVQALHPDGRRWSAEGRDGVLAVGRAVVVATGDAAGGGVRKAGRIRPEPDPGGELWFGDRPLRQDAAPLGPAVGAFLPERLWEGGPVRTVGVAVDERMRPAGAAPGLFLAGALAKPAAGSSDGLAWALVSGLRAARGALEASGPG